MVRIVTSTSAAARLQAAAQFLDRQSPARDVLIVGASRGAADDAARAIARRRGATFGLVRASLTELAARVAATRTGVRHTPGSDAGAEALAARVVFDATAAGDLAYFGPVASMPGFPKALARTLHELRLAGVSAARLGGAGVAASDIGALLARMEAELERAGVDDRAALFHAATEACREAPSNATSLLLLDVAVNSRAERDFVAALVVRSADTLITIPDGDQRTIDACVASVPGGQVPGDDIVERLPDVASASSDLAHLRQYVFTNAEPPRREPAGDVRLFSAPGEGREALEIVRRVLDEASRGTPFDEMAIFLRAPRQYLGLLEHAFARAGVPVYFDRGTRRPDPAGRAFVALLSSAVEGLSAKRFDEYLSLGQVPRLDRPRPAQAAGLARPRDEVFIEIQPDVDAEDPDADDDPAPVDSDDEAIVAGTLRSPWKWEELIVESAVVGGRTRTDGHARWRRRLDGLAADYRFRRDELRRDEPDSPRLARLERDLRDLAHLRAFALPLIDTLAEWPERATWGEWLDRLATLAVRAVDKPERVLRVLADLRPMADVGPVTLEEARDVLHDRLVELDWDPPARRYGRVFVGTPHQARGRVFRVVFVPGLAERVVPQRPHEDPLLLDARRRAIDPALAGQDERSRAERLLLKIAIGAAAERAYLSYPRMDVAETRARVPSFYALDVMRAITGRVPDYRELATRAEEEGDATLAWPAPTDPDRAIDDLEHDLAVLKPLIDSRDPASVKGRAHYMLDLNDALKRSVISRWRRGRATWSASDGMIDVSNAESAGARALSRHRLGTRAYSLSALQRFSTCPYQFVLATIYRLEPRDEPEPLLRLDPLTRGSLFHTVQAEFFRERLSAGALPILAAAIPEAAAALDAVLDRVAGDYAEQLAPAIDRVWRDEIGEIRRDLAIWVQKLAEDTNWVPQYFELSFGLLDAGRDPASLREPVMVDGRFLLHGSVDLIERRADLDLLRVTDHKTGKNRSTPDLIVGGGKTLQPVLYSAAIEQGLGKKVLEGRLFYCTTAGGFGTHPIPINDYTRGQGLEVLTIIDRAIERGFLVAAPDKDACRWCDFRAVCGPREEERVRRKNASDLEDLRALRSMR